ncbi:tail fiber protein [uncultured Desulfobacter sp.]|uniref:phage tail protein n=1 Tax=uncultured Desulfobacter sp. TaxID=240139 RepID=UPI002AAC3060|nr:tail fiber protein [uncultured Desulfobacter sp.]
MCNGDMYTPQDQGALFSLLGCTYGGDCRTSFALPDLRGRSPIGYGTGPGLYGKAWGQKGGNQTHTLKVQELPSHTHSQIVSSAPGTLTNPHNAFLAAAGDAAFTGTVPGGIPVTGSTTIKGQTGALQDGKTSESRDISGSVSSKLYSTTVDTQMNDSSIGNTGGGIGFGIESPYLAMLYVIALSGMYPPRN